MTLLTDSKDVLGALSVALALVAAIVYVWQTLVGQVRPHPLSWALFGVLSGTGFLMQRAEGALQGSWALLAMTAICLILAGLSIAKGERRFPAREWLSLAAGCAAFVVYLFSRDPTLAAILITLVDAFGYGPTFSRGWSQPQKDSAISFALNGVKFVPSLLAMAPISIATCAYPATLMILNSAVAAMLIVRRQALRAI